MAEVPVAQSPEAEDVTMLSADDSRVYDPMDISYTPPANQQLVSSQPMGVAAADPKSPVPHNSPFVPTSVFTRRRFSKPILLTTKPKDPQANTARAETRFCLTAGLTNNDNANADSGMTYAPPVRNISNSRVLKSVYADNSHKSYDPNIARTRAKSHSYLPNNTSFVGMNRHKPFVRQAKHATNGHFWTAPSASGASGIQRRKTLAAATEGSKATTLFPTSTYAPSVPRKRSFDAEEPSNVESSPVDTKYRKSGDLTTLLHDGSQEAPAQNIETRLTENGGHLNIGQQPTMAATNQHASILGHAQDPFPSVPAFGSSSPSRTPGRQDKSREVSREQSIIDTRHTYVPGSWPEQTPLNSDRVFTTPNETPGSRVQRFEINQNTTRPPASVSWIDLIQYYCSGPNGLKDTMVSMFRSAVGVADTVKRRALGVVQWRRRRRPDTTRASPTRTNLRGLSEEQRHRVRSRQWDRDRGHPILENLPFPELSIDIPQFPIAAGPSSVVESHAVSPDTVPKSIKSPKKRNVTDPLRLSTAPNASLAKDKHRKKSPKGLLGQSRMKSKSGINKRSLVKKSSLPNLQRRMILDRTSARRNLSVLQAFREMDANLPKDMPVKPKRELTEPETPKHVEPQDQTPFADLKTDLAPHLHPTSPSSIKTAPAPETTPVTKFVPATEPLSEEAPSDDQKENVPPVATEVEPVVDPWHEPAPEFPLGRSVSAVRLVDPVKKPLPAGRTESIYASQWKEIEEETKRNERPSRIKPEGLAVRPLTGKWKTRLEETMSVPNNRKVATTLAGDPLTKRDLATCYNQAVWLNDEVINSYLALIVDYLRRANGNAGRTDKPRYHAFNTFFFSNLRDKGYQSVRRWATRAKIGGDGLLNVDSVFIPVHNSSHWTLVLVKPSERTIENFDSMGTVSRRHVALVKSWLRGELGEKFVEEEWTVLPSASPQQDNGSDCGVFLLSTAKAVAIGLEPLSYGAKDIPLLRQKIVAEILNGGLEGDFEPSREAEVLL